MPSFRLPRSEASQVLWAKRVHVVFLVPCASAIILLGARPDRARAQTATDSTTPEALAEVVVQAQRRSENAQDVPIAMTTLSAAALSSTGVTSTSSLSVDVPGLVVASTQGAFQPRLRGVGTTFFGPGIENPVALYVDNVYYGSQVMAPDDLSDVSQVAVLKGPQGTLFGRNSTGGVIQMSTLAPQADFAAQFRTDIDNYLTSRSFAYATGQVVDGLNANLSVKYTAQGNGWGDNLVNGDQIFRINSDVAVRNKWVWAPADETTVDLGFDWQRRNDSMGPNYYVPAVPGFTGVFPGIGVTLAASNPYDVTNWATDDNQLRQGGGSIQINQGVGGPQLVSITAYRSFQFDNFSAADGSTTPVSGVDYHTHGTQFSQELHLLSAKGGPLKWLLGAYYYRDSETLNPMNLPYYGLLAQIYYGPTAVTADEEFNVDLTTDSIAGFGQGTLQLGDATELTLGARYTHERRTIVGPVTNFINSLPFPAFNVDLNGEYSESKPTWRVALDHRFSETLMGYVSDDRGFKSGGFNAFTSSDVPYKAETVDSYEIGLKSEVLDQRVRINPAFFYSKYHNMQLLLVQGCCLVATNAAQSVIYGVDLDAEWQVADSLAFSGGAEWLHARFGYFPDDPTSLPVPGGGIDSVLTSGMGLMVPLAPVLVVDVAVDYSVHIAESRLDFNVTESHNGGYYFEPDNRAHQDAFNMVNASVTWTAPGNRLSVGLFGRNLGNTVIPSTLSASAPFSYLAINGNPPRVYGLTVRYRFGKL